MAITSAKKENGGGRIGSPPKKNKKEYWRIYNEVYDHYIHNIAESDKPNVYGKSAIRKRVKDNGMDVVKQVIEFYDKWLKEDNWKNENFRYRGISWFFPYKFDEVKNIMRLRESKKPKYKNIEQTNQYDRMVDPFQR